MPSLSEHDDDPHPQPDRGNRRLMVPVILVVVVMIFVLLHLTGVLGPGRAQKAVGDLVLLAGSLHRSGRDPGSYRR